MHVYFIRKIMIVLLIFVLFIPAASTASAQGTVAEAGVFEAVEVAPGATIQVPISIRNVEGLYGFDLTLKFDPDKVKVVDMDPAAEGVQVSLGKFLDPGLLLFNTADNEKGTFHFTMSQYNPSEAKSGSGVLLVITFTGVNPGESPLEVSDLILATREGEVIPSKGINAAITVTTGAAAQQATYPVAEATGMIVIQTFTPTPTITVTPSSTPSPEATATPVLQGSVESQAPGTGGTSPGSEPSRSFFMLENWWIILVLLILVVGGGIYLFKRSSKHKERES